MSPIQENNTIAVVLLNLGGPEKLTDVEPFLYNLFSDRLIIRLGPWFMQKPIARWIAWRRAPKSQSYYEKIGGGSPLKQITANQGQALAGYLKGAGSFQVFMAMRYWRPFAEETITQITQAGIKKVVALTLYPHYSIATTGSSLADLRHHAGHADLELTEIAAWPEEPHYIACLAQGILEMVKALGGDDGLRVMYSAHSLPVKFIREGDPYLDHLKATIAKVEAITGLAGTLCFQSRSGPVEWLAPSTPDTITALAAKGCTGIVVVPISFVSDHVETLCEIDIIYRQQAEELGLRFARTASLNLQPGFIAGLGELVTTACRQRGWLPPPNLHQPE